MVRPDVEPLRAILHRALVRYLTVTPQGLVFGDETRKHSSVSARILGFGGARSLYRRRKPICRSLDGIVAIDNPRKRCAECVHHGACTPQVRVDLIARLRAYRMLLAYTSARNFLEYEATLRRDGIAIEDVMHEISVVPRGSWGELRFRRLDY